MAYQCVDVPCGVERRRAYTPAEKARLVAEAFRPGVMVKEAARRLGVHDSLLYRWRRGLSAVPEPVEPTPTFLPVTVLADSEPEPDRRPTASEPPPGSPPDPPVSIPPSMLEVTLPGGARVRMRGAVDAALAVSVLNALSPPGRPS